MMRGVCSRCACSQQCSFREKSRRKRGTSLHTPSVSTRHSLQAPKVTLSSHKVILVAHQNSHTSTVSSAAVSHCHRRLWFSGAFSLRAFVVAFWIYSSPLRVQTLRALPPKGATTRFSLDLCLLNRKCFRSIAPKWITLSSLGCFFIRDCCSDGDSR